MYTRSNDVSSNRYGIFVDGISITDVMFLGKYLGLMAAMVGLMGTSKSIANEVVGA